MSGEVAACINTCIKLADFCLKVNAAPEETRVFGRLIDRVRIDRGEALRERYEKAKALEDFPEKRKWVDDIIHDTTEALQTIGKLVEAARIDVAKGKKVTLQHRFEWVLSKKEDFLAKQSWLATCHRSLSNVLAYMQTLEARPRGSESSVAGAAASPPPEYAEALLRSPSARKPVRKRMYTLSDPPADVMKTKNSSLEEVPEEDRDTSDSEDSDTRLSTPASWDDLPPNEAAEASVAAMQSQLGPNSKTAAFLAELVQRTATLSHTRDEQQKEQVSITTVPLPLPASPPPPSSLPPPPPQETTRSTGSFEASKESRQNLQEEIVSATSIRAPSRSQRRAALLRGFGD